MLQNEIFYSLDQVALLSPNDILTHCIVTGTPPSWHVNGDSGYINYDELQDENGAERYYCHFALNSQRGLYYEIDWQEHRDVALEVDADDVEGDPWDVVVQEDDPRESRVKEKSLDVPATKKGKKPAAGKRGSKEKKKVKREHLSDGEDEAEDTEDGGSGDEYEGASDEEEEEDALASDSELSSIGGTDEDDEEEHTPRTPSKKRKRSTASRSPSKRKAQSLTTTPRKRAPGRKAVAPTPHSRKIIAARKQKKVLRVRPPPALTSHLQLENLPSDPWLRAMHVLHVGARPDVLPCREEEYARCLRAVEELLEEGSGGCVCQSRSS